MIDLARAHDPPEIRGGCEKGVSIGLVNNMPPRSQAPCEQRFRGLFDSGSFCEPVRWRLFDATCRSAWAGRRSPHGVYEPLDALFEAELDAVIVTGAEPQASTMQEEPIWDVVARIARWAEDRGVAVLWSCLASHAAVRYLDGVERSRLVRKLSGLYPCRIVSLEHGLTQGVEGGSSTPHSRWHSLRRQELELAGYEILTDCNSEEVDCFWRGGGRNFLFCQGHPEYLIDTLWLEYKRDLLRFARGESKSAPELPADYIGGPFETRIQKLREHATGASDIQAGLRHIEVGPGFLPNSVAWAGAARRLCSNWLDHAVARRLTSPVRRCFPGDGSRSCDLVWSP